MLAGHSISTFALVEGDETVFFALANNNIIPSTDISAREQAAAPVYTYSFCRNPDHLPSREALEALAGAMHENPAQAGSESSIPAGYTYLVQFIFHDITHFSLRTGRPKNQTSAALDMESVLGTRNNPAESTSENPNNAVRIGLTSNDYGNLPPRPDDVPRVPRIGGSGPADQQEGYPLIADLRNEGFLQLNQMHVIFLKFYNAVARQTGFDTPGGVKAAKQTFLQHVQAVVLHDLLPRLIDPDILADVVTGGRRRVIHPTPVSAQRPFRIPIEFAFAVARFGHAMVRESYDWNDTHRNDRAAGLADLITHSHLNSDPDRLPLSRLERDWVVDWHRFFDFSHLPGVPIPVMANRIAPALAETMGRLPSRLASPDQSPVSTPTFNLGRATLMRQIDLILSTAQMVIQKINESTEELPPIVALSPEELAGEPLGAIGQVFVNFPELFQVTPLWFYILREAEIRGGGNRLGPVGSRILAETFHAAIEATGELAVTATAGWKPTLPCREKGRFTMVDLISFAQSN